MRLYSLKVYWVIFGAAMATFKFRKPESAIGVEKPFSVVSKLSMSTKRPKANQ
jgi:hypothetical protein